MPFFSLSSVFTAPVSKQCVFISPFSSEPAKRNLVLVSRMANAMENQSALQTVSFRWSKTIRLLLAGILMTPSGCASSLLNLTGENSFGSKLTSMMSRDKSIDIVKEEDNEFDTRLETPLLRDYISVTGNNVIAIRGVGLVTGLDGTGGDPPPSHLRKELLDEMTRRKIPNPGAILASRNTALVMITAYLPAMVRDKQKFDVRVMLPPNSEATSLKGGWLLETRLSEEQTIAGRGNVKGHEYAVAYGAILTALGDGSYTKDNAAMLRRGSIPGGAISNTERNLEVVLRNEYRGLKTSKRIENAISNRLHHYNRFGQRVPMAEAKTDLMLELMVHPLYRNNFPRYQQMIRSIALRETDVARRMRMEKLATDIQDPEKAANSSLQLEAIGRDAIPFLKAALQSPSLEVRFHAAQALAYLEDGSGVEVLKEAAETEAAFRVYALAALSVVTEADAVVALRELLSDDALETRYGAVRALKENNANDPYLGTQTFANQFVLHAIDSTGPPAVHVVRYRAPEVVVFGIQQELRLPATLYVGNRIAVKGDAGENTVTVTKYELDQEPKRHVVSTNLIEIIQAVAQMGATYPDVVQMLLEADSQHNLKGELGIDRLPQAGRVFTRAFDESDREQKAKLGTPSLTPGLFDRIEEEDKVDPRQDSSALSRMFAAGEDADSSDTQSAADLDEGASLEDADDMIDPDRASAAKTALLEIDEMDLSEEAAAADDAGVEEAEFKLEKSEFQEPLGSRIRRAVFSPFQKQE